MIFPRISRRNLFTGVCGIGGIPGSRAETTFGEYAVSMSAFSNFEELSNWLQEANKNL
jgi:hypothetical protein